MFCNKCGTQLTGNEGRCPRCNASIDLRAGQAGQPDTSGQLTGNNMYGMTGPMPNQYPPQPVWQPGMQPAMQPPKKKKTGLIAAIAIFAVTLIAAITVILVAVLKKDKDEDPVTEASPTSVITTELASVTETTEAVTTEVTTEATTTEATTTEEVTTEAPKPEGQDLVEEAINYYQGINGVEYDRAKAKELFQQAREKGNGDAAYYIGLMHVETDNENRYARAKKCYKEAEENGSALGIYGRAWLTRRGMGCEANPEKAVKLYEEALEKGCDRAGAQLGWMYEYGVGVKQNAKKAKKYYTTAMKSEDKTTVLLATTFLGQFYEYDHDAIKQDDEQALKYLKRAAKEGYSYALYLLGAFYGRGSEQLNLDPDPEKELHYYERAAAKDEENSIRELARIYYNGTETVEQNYEKSFEYNKRGTELGDGGCMESIAYNYYYGLGTEQNYEKAFQYSKLAEDANADGYYRMLGHLYYIGKGVEQDYENALKYYQIGMEEEDPWCTTYLGYMYSTGQGVAQDNDKAKELLNRALELYQTYDDSNTSGSTNAEMIEWINSILEKIE